MPCSVDCGGGDGGTTCGAVGVGDSTSLSTPPPTHFSATGVEGAGVEAAVDGVEGTVTEDALWGTMTLFTFFRGVEATANEAAFSSSALAR